jgi:hypothetical protein
MSEFIFKRTDYTHSDLEKDRRSVHKKGDLINYKTDGWSDTPGWGQSQYPVKFVVVKCPEISFEEAETADYRGTLINDSGVDKRHRYSISVENVDAIIAAGGIVTRTKAQLLADLIDHQGV